MKKLLFIGLVVLLSSCATSYQPVGFSGGYSDTRLSENVFRVSFRGNGYTSAERATDFSLLRGAELALNNGYDYFLVVDSTEDNSYSTYTTPTHVNTNAYSNTSGKFTSMGSNLNYSGSTYGAANTTISGGQSFLIKKPSTTNTIICFKQKPLNYALYVLEPKFVIESIKQKYGIN